MKLTRTWVVSMLFVLITLAVALWAYPRLPAMTPTHWDADGNVNGWTPKFWATAIPVLVQLGIALLRPLLPYVSPRRFEIAPFARTYSIVVLAIQAALMVILVAALLAGAGHHVPITLIGTVAIGALWIVIGNYMGKLRKNFFIGIRTPWTLASDAVWERTHRLAGWMFVLAGLAWIAAGLAGAAPKCLIVIVVLAVAVPYVGSYLIYRRIEAGQG